MINNSTNTTEYSINVIIPAYNAGNTIRETLDSVLKQTVKPNKIIVCDDGSTDNTAQIVKSMYPDVKLIQQNNMGVAEALNELFQEVSKSEETLIALLDSDDIWSTRYLETQLQIHKMFPNAIASFVGHSNFIDSLPHNAPNEEINIAEQAELMSPEKFIVSCYEKSGFYGPSFCVIKSHVITKLGDRPIPTQVNRCQDFYLWYVLALNGPIVGAPVIMAYYRLRENSLSHDRVNLYINRIDAMNAVVDVYRRSASPQMLKLAMNHLAGSYRLLGKHLMGDGDVNAARLSLWQSLNVSFSLKSLIMIALTYLPEKLQPRWPARWRTDI